MGYGNGTGGYYLPAPAKKKVPVAPKTNSPTGRSTVPGTSSQAWYQNPNTTYDWEPSVPGASSMTQAQKAGYQYDLYKAGIPLGRYGNQPAGAMPSMGGGGGYGGGGGGGGGPAGMDQETLDWLIANLGKGRPAQNQFEAIDLPDPRSYYSPFDTSAYDTARAGVSSGIDAMRQRGNQAFDNAQTELNQYKNPYSQAAWAQNPDVASKMAAMFGANGTPTSLMDQTTGEGVQADRAFGNVMALLAGNDQQRQAGNQRALAGDRQMMDTNLGLEQNMLNLGVNTSQGKAKSAYDQMLNEASYQSALNEMMQNWQRKNTVSDTNTASANSWNSDILGTLMQLVSGKASGVKLPPDISALFGGVPA